MAITPVETERRLEESLEKKENETALLEKEFRRITEQEKLDISKFESVMRETTEILQSESESIRPQDAEGLPGGLLELKKNIPLLVLHDIHGRREYLLGALLEKDEQNKTNLEKMMAGELQIVCIGDALHTETGSKAKTRWFGIAKEAEERFEFSPHMDAEIADSFGVIEMIMRLKNAAPDNFHYLRGNHDNIEELRIMKFNVPLNRLVRQYLQEKYPPDFIRRYRDFEQNLPFIAVHKKAVISHAEPKREYSRDQIINAKKYPAVSAGLVWTGSPGFETAQKDSVEKNLNTLLPPQNAKEAVWLGGHKKTTAIKYKKGISDKFIYFYNPSRMNVALVSPSEPFNPEKDIHSIKRIDSGAETVPGDVLAEIEEPASPKQKFKEGQEVRVPTQTTSGNFEFQDGWRIVGRDPDSDRVWLQHPSSPSTHRVVSEAELAEWVKKP